MKSHRIVGIVIGTVLGFTAAGWMQRATLAVEASHSPHQEASAASSHDDHGDNPAEALAPRDEPISFMRPVVGGVVGLFVAAVVLGVPALKLRGPEPPDPADAHGHDDHGGGHDGHH